LNQPTRSGADLCNAVLSIATPRDADHSTGFLSLEFLRAAVTAALRCHAAQCGANLRDAAPSDAQLRNAERCHAMPSTVFFSLEVSMFDFVEVWITGTMPMLMARFGELAEASVPGGSGKGTRPIDPDAGVSKTPREHAEQMVYRDAKGLCFPGPAIARLLCEAGSNHKMKGSRRAVKWIVPAAVSVLDDMMPLYLPDRETRITEYEVDSRRVVNPKTKGALLCHRPRLEQWSARFTLRIKSDLLKPALVRQLLTEGGQMIGIGAFRPEKRGPFGVFDVVAWDCVDGRSASAKRGKQRDQDVA